MIKRITLTENDISWSSFRCASPSEQEKRIREVETVLNSIIFANNSKEIENVINNYIFKSNGNKVRIRCFVTFLSFNDREGHILRYSLENNEIVTKILDSKTKEEIRIEKGFYGWKPHRIYNYDVVNTLYRILYPAKKYHNTKIK